MWYVYFIMILMIVDVWIEYLQFERSYNRFTQMQRIYNRGLHSVDDVASFEEKYNLLQTNKRICSKFPTFSQFKVYRPHMTIAYLKKGMADKPNGKI